MKKSTYLVRVGDKIENLTNYFGIEDKPLYEANPQVAPGQLLTPGTFISLPSSTKTSAAQALSLGNPPVKPAQ